MISLYIAGKKVGTLADFDRIIAHEDTKNRIIEFLDDAGTPVGNFTPKISGNHAIQEWEKELTPDELQRRQAEPSFSYDEVKHRLGWV